ncbi:MAG: GNAT family N-acetyltransferase [Bacteroidaceae bacterium]|nr:GNAT family N-acetyltransferase [Bacteroidaceae bacterium]
MDDKITLRRATVADARFIAENVLRALHIDETDDSHIEHLAGISRRDDTLYSWRNSTIALYDGVPAGLMVAYDGARYRQMRDITFPMIRIYVGDDYHSMDDEACAGEYYLDSLAVLPEFQHRGIASALIQEMFRQRDEAGIPLATIAVDPENDTAYGLYIKNGFHKNGQITVFNTTYDRLERKA